MLCPNCHTDNRSNAKYCDECGFELPTVAPFANEMFGEGATSRLDAETRSLQGIDEYTDSSHSPHSDDYDDREAGYDDPNITQAFVAPSYSQKRTYYSDAGVSRGGGQAPYATGGFPVQQSMPKPPGKASRRAKGVLIAILCILVLAAAGAGIAYSLQLWGGKIVPDVISMYSEEATDKLEADGFKVEVVLVKSDEPENIVLSTDPQAGVRVDDGSTVTIEVSMARTIPDVVGKPLEDAMKLMSAEGFTNVEVIEVKSNEAEGTVTSIAPIPGTRSKGDAKITIEAAVPYRVPDVHGMSQADATAALENEGYAVSVGYVYDEDVGEGDAVGTDPSSGTALASGSDVTLNLAKHRSAEVIGLTRTWLNDSSKVRINGQDYEISEVTNVSYDGGSTCSYSIIARKFETHSWFGSQPETRYGNNETITGSITWNDSNEISNSSPKIERI